MKKMLTSAWSKCILLLNFLLEKVIAPVLVVVCIILIVLYLSGDLGKRQAIVEIQEVSDTAKGSGISEKILAHKLIDKINKIKGQMTSYSMNNKVKDLGSLDDVRMAVETPYFSLKITNHLKHLS